MAADDDLTRPLGLTEPRKRVGRVALAGLAGAGALAITAAVGFVWLGSPGAGPTASAPIVDAVTVDATELTGSTVPDSLALRDTPGLVEITPDGALLDLGEVIIHNPSDGSNLRLAALPEIDLLEDGRYGPLPRISPGGRRPLEAYARPVAGASRADRVAIVISGIGINATGTAEAIRSLPGEVTLALAPYGESLHDALVEARRNGHELLLQIPLEPFDYPATDPGPHTLTRTADEATNLDRLHWLLSRTTNYIGVMNYLGARFTGDPSAFAPVLDELGKRGLLYLDDGASSRSVASDIARGRAPFLRADLVLDGELTEAAIDRRLDQLQAIARERGYAVATGSAFPLTIERVSAFARRAADRGILLVPLSALLPSQRT